LTGIFGYASTVLSGWGLGVLVQKYSWDRAFLLLLIVAAIATVVFVFAWSAPRDGYTSS
jgi:OPA family glycerol-3-phosphate transporter-like MFS transporter/OPA family sugar phosphate sensor protein UhpC-like MFS transporter